MKKEFYKYIILSVSFISMVIFLNFGVKDTITTEEIVKGSNSEIIELAAVTPRSTDIKLSFTTNTGYTAVRNALYHHEVIFDPAYKTITVPASVAETITTIRISYYAFGDVSDIVVLNKLPNLKEIRFGYCRNLVNLDSLSLFTNIESLIFDNNDFTDISFITSVPNLKRLSLNGEDSITNLDEIENLTNLDYLKVSNANFTDIPKLPNIREIDLSGNSITDFSILNQYSNLEVVNLENNDITSIPDISSLNNLSTLKSLNLDYNNITEVSSMEAFPNLEILSLYKQDNDLTTVSNINNMSSLKELRLSLGKETDFDTLTNLPSLINLEIFNYDGEKIPSNILNFTNLEALEIYDSNLSDISDITTFTKLKKLELTYGEIEDISPIEQLINLEYLDLSNNIIKDITPIYNLSNLTYLDIGYNRVSDINDLFLQEGILNNVEDLILENNIITDITEIDNLVSKSSLANLNWLSLRGNAISEIDGIETATDLEYDMDFQEHYIYLDDLSDYTTPAWVARTKDATDINYYLSGDHYCFKCTLSDDFKTVSFDPDPDPAYYPYLMLGYYSGEGVLINSSLIFEIDKVTPTVSVIYTPNGTNSNLVTIQFNEAMQEVDGFTLSRSRYTLKKEYFVNTTETISFKDLAGNIVDVNIEVTNIEDPKVVEQKYEPLDTHENNVTITFDKEMQEVDGWTLSSDKKTFTKKFLDNFNSSIEFKDIYGNKVSVLVEVNNIENLRTLETKYNAIDSKKNTVTVTFNRQMEQTPGWSISSDLKTLTKTFTENYSGSVMFADIYGDTIYVPITISNIKEDNNVVVTPDVPEDNQDDSSGDENTDGENDNQDDSSGDENTDDENDNQDDLDDENTDSDNDDTNNENNNNNSSDNEDENKTENNSSMMFLILIVVVVIVMTIIFIIKRNED